MQRFVQSLRPVIALVLVLWAVEIVNWLSGHALVQFGILPRSASGLVGIVFAPLLHANFVHLLSNTVPVLVLGGLVAATGRERFVPVAILVGLGGGIGVWLLARPAYHVGASILVFGFFGYLLANAYFERSVRAFLVAAVTVLLYAGLIWGVLPGRTQVSWEGHLFGALAGIGAAHLLRRRGRARRP